MQQQSWAASNGCFSIGFAGAEKLRWRPAMALDGRRALFISYNGMFEPLGQTQVIPYLTELVKRGVAITLLSFEKPQSLTEEKCLTLREKLSQRGIEWHWLRYHRRPTLAATAYDVLAGIRCAKRLIRENDIEIIHARAYIPATIAMWLKRQQRVKMIFDLR